MEQDLVTTVVLKGGVGSGFYGHKGRKGLVGGSISVDTLNSVTTNTIEEYDSILSKLCEMQKNFISNSKKSYKYTEVMKKRFQEVHDESDKKYLLAISKSEHYYKLNSSMYEDVLKILEKFGSTGLEAENIAHYALHPVDGLPFERLITELIRMRDYDNKTKEHNIIVVLKGGAGSGFFDHKGRPGEEGGSLPRGSSNIANRFIEYDSKHIETLKRCVNTSFFHEDKLHQLNKTLAASLQKQYEVLGFDPMEILRRGHNKVYMLDNHDFEASHKYYFKESAGEILIGFISPTGSIYLNCGRWTPYLRNGELSEFDMETLARATIDHEFGHVLMDNVNPGWYVDNPKGWQIDGRKAIGDWKEGYDKGTIGHHTKYSNKNMLEGFAESYMSYVATGGIATDPDTNRTYAAVKKVIDAARLKYIK